MQESKGINRFKGYVVAYTVVNNAYTRLTFTEIAVQNILEENFSWRVFPAMMYQDWIGVTTGVNK